MKKFLKKSLKKKRLLMSLATAGVAAVALPIVLTSCSTTTNSSTELGVTTFDATQTIKKVNQREAANADSNPIDNPTTLEVVDPNLNTNAQDKAKDTFRKTLTVDKLQQDFNRVLKSFYKAYEYEVDGQIEQEAEIKSIKVDSFDKTSLTAKLSVTYKVETEVDSRDDEKVEEVTQQKDFNITPYFATYAEIDNITAMLKKLEENSGDQEGNNFEIDVEDLLEIYVGNPDDNKSSVFEQINALTTNTSKYGGLLGYSINVSDLAYTPKSTKYNLIRTDLTKQDLFAPSSVIRDFFKPNVENVITANKIDLTLSYEKISKYTAEQLKTITSYDGTTQSEDQPEGAKNTVLGLKHILRTELTTEQSKLIKAVLVKDLGDGDLEVRVQITDADTPTPMIVQLMIDGNWYKPVATPSGPTA